MTVSFPNAGDNRLKVGRVVYEDWGRDLSLIAGSDGSAPSVVAGL